MSNLGIGPDHPMHNADAVARLLDKGGQSREFRLLRDLLGTPGLKDRERLGLWQILVGFRELVERGADFDRVRVTWLTTD